MHLDPQLDSFLYPTNFSSRTAATSSLGHHHFYHRWSRWSWQGAQISSRLEPLDFFLVDTTACDCHHRQRHTTSEATVWALDNTRRQGVDAVCPSSFCAYICFFPRIYLGLCAYIDDVPRSSWHETPLMFVWPNRDDDRSIDIHDDGHRNHHATMGPSMGVPLSNPNHDDGNVNASRALGWYALVCFLFQDN